MATPTPTPKQVAAAFQLCAAVAEAVRELKQVSSGSLYAVLAGRMDLETYEGIIRILTKAGLVAESNNLLTWVGPEVA